VFSLRNWDLLMLFLLVPGFLVLQEAHILLYTASQNGFEKEVASSIVSGWVSPLAVLMAAQAKLTQRGNFLLSIGYIWLIAGSGYWFARCVFDLALVRRPALTPNLNLPGLAWLAAALFIFMTVVAIHRMPDVPVEQIGREPIALVRVQEGASNLVNYQAGVPELEKADTKFWVERVVAMGLHLGIMIGLVLIGGVHFGDTTAGMAMACLYLLLPYTAFHVSQVHHAWPAMFLVWAVYSYQKPILCGALLGVAAGTVFFPLLLFPLWFGFYRGRGAGRFSAGFLFSTSLALAVTGLILLSQGDLRRHLSIALSLSDWQAWKVPHTESIWTGAHWAYRMPIFILYMAFVVLTIFWPRPRDLAQVIAQTAAVVVGVQFWYADQGGVYVLWYLPLLLILVFRPNLSERRPPVVNPDTDWLRRWRMMLVSWMRRMVVRTPRPKISLR
jgi:hypothetical protein